MTTIYKLIAKMFNYKAAASSSKADEIVSKLRIKKGYVIADIGSGGGYFTFVFAKRAGKKGIVYAVDTNRHFLKYIDEKAQQEGIANVITVAADNLDNIPLNSINLIFIRNVYHHIHDPQIYFENLKKYLRDDGRIVIIDYKKRKGFSIHNLFGHYIEAGEVEANLESAGYKPVKKHNFLSCQEFLVFETKQ